MDLINQSGVEFSIEEINRTIALGDYVAAVKMVRVTTGAGLKDAMIAVRTRTVEKLPTFEEQAAKKRLKEAAPNLLAALTAVLLFVKPTLTNSAALNAAHLAIAKAEGRE